MAEVLIIGGGVAGLSTGIYAQLAGHHATVCEMHSRTGGNLTAWKRRGYQIDNCIHWLTGTNKNTPAYKMWEDLGVLGDDIKIIQHEVMLTAEYEGRRISLYRDLDRTIREMLTVCPEDASYIKEFEKNVKSIMGFMGIGGKEKNIKDPSWKSALALPSLLKVFCHSAGDIAKKCRDPLMKRFVVAMFGPNFSAITLPVVAAVFCGDNGGIPVESSDGAARHMEERFLALGGRVLTGWRAERVEMENGRARAVHFANRETLYCEELVLCGDPRSEFGTLLDIPMPAKIKKQYNDPANLRFSSFHAAFACPAEDVPFEGTMAIDVPMEYQSLVRSNQILVREFSHEPGFSPEGRNILQTMNFCCEKECREALELAKDKEAYRKDKDSMGKALAHIIETHFPSLQGKLDCLDVWTPASYKRYVGSEIGSYMSFSLLPGRVPHMLPSKVDGCENVYLATQWQMVPGGLPIAARAGKAAAEAIGPAI